MSIHTLNRLFFVTTCVMVALLKGLELIVDMDAVVPDALRGDPGRLRQILVRCSGAPLLHQGENRDGVEPMWGLMNSP